MSTKEIVPRRCGKEKGRRICVECLGYGTFISYPKLMLCEKCSGTGYVLMVKT